LTLKENAQPKKLVERFFKTLNLLET
jgi:hypothetical protein